MGIDSLHEARMEAANAIRFAPLLQPTLVWLDERRRAAVAAHLRRLEPCERARRFGRFVADGEIGEIVERLDFRTDWLAGAQSFDQRLIGVAHACPLRTGREYTVYAAISVDADYRGRGLGRALLGMVVDRLHATAAASVVAIGSSFDLPDDDFVGNLAYELCTGVRIEAERCAQSRMNSSFSSPTSTTSPFASSVGASSIE